MLSKKAFTDEEFRGMSRQTDASPSCQQWAGVKHSTRGTHITDRSACPAETWAVLCAGGDSSALQPGVGTQHADLKLPATQGWLKAC